MRHLLFALLLSLLLVGIGGLGRAGASDTEGVLIQAEAFASRRPDVEGYARVIHEPEASGGRVLSRLLERGGRCTWALQVPRRARWVGWVRYAALRPQRLGVSIDGEERAPALLAPTGGLSGKKAWRWARLFEMDLDVGAHRLEVGTAPLRLDCFWITTDPLPLDFDVPVAVDRVLGARKQAALDRSPTPVRPAWIDEGKRYRLPAWFDGCRVAAHTRLGPSWRKKPLFLDAGHRLRTLGFREMTRHIKSGAEGAWWPSAVGAVEPWARTRNVAAEIIEEAHAAGERILVYHRHIEDRAAAEAHPDWVCRDERGRPLEAPRGPHLCMNSPYAAFVETRLLELTKMGADGFYFDSIHMPRDGCWCDACRAAFRKETGLDAPETRDPADPVARRYKDFENEVVERTFLRWRRAVHAVNPACVLVVGSNTWPSFLERHLSNRLFRLADSVKTEFAKGPTKLVGYTDAALSFGWDLARDAADGRPAHVWSVGLVDETAACFATAGIVAHGSVANLDQQEGEIPDRARFAKAVALGNAASDALRATRPLPWALVHVSERARDALWAEPRAALHRVVWPAYGAYRALLRARRPVVLITDSQLEEGVPQACRLLVLSGAGRPTEAMATSIAAFCERGGIVVDPDPEWRWDEGTPAAFAEVLGTVPSPPVEVVGGPEVLHACTYRSRDGTRLVVALAQDFSFVRTGKVKTRAARLAALDPADVPLPAKGIELHVHRAARPKRVTDGLAGGTPLPLRGEAGAWRIALPAFGPLAVVVIELE